MREPDLTFWFELNPAIAAQRLSQARAPDRFEAQDLAFFERVAQGYSQRAAEAPERFVRLDAAQERHQVWQQLQQVLVRKGLLPTTAAQSGAPS